MISSTVLAQWRLSGSQVKLGKGLINDTFCIDDRNVLQRINRRVFVDPKRIVTNFMRVYDRLVDLVPRLIPTVAGEYCFEDDEGEIWRCFDYHPSRNFQSIPDEMVYAAGQAFGSFLFRLRECTVHLEPAVKNFHEFQFYLSELEQAWSDREEEIDRSLLGQCREIASAAPISVQQQIIHGDCKVDNLLFDVTNNKVVRIVDTDTLMWGCPFWDFGDLVRSVAMDSAADDQLTRRLTAVSAGFFEQFPIAKAEAECYASAPIHMSMMLGVRFLTDHFVGNQYFKVNRVGENLHRAKEQFKLAEKFDSIQETLHNTILTISDDHL